MKQTNQIQTITLKTLRPPSSYLHELEVSLLVLVASRGTLEVARIGQAVGADGAQLRQTEVAVENLARVPAHNRVSYVDLEADASLHNCDCVGGHVQIAKLGADGKGSKLRHCAAKRGSQY